MGKYSERNPARGRDVVQGASNVKTPGAPSLLPEDLTPAEGLVDEDGHINIDVALPYLIVQSNKLKHEFARASQSSQLQDTAKVGEFEQQIERAQKWGGWIWGIGAGFIATVGIIFSAGVAWQVFWGENATDSEVEKFVHETIIEHNGGVDPWATDDSTQEPVGHHPEIYRLLHAHEESLDSIQEKIEEGARAREKQALQAEYQFEFARWQAAISEAERRGRRAPRKPPDLEKIEKRLMGFGR